ncbi:MAG: hypothetical protein WBC69_16750 [Geitlerinemataceae cyanobacterium]
MKTLLEEVDPIQGIKLEDTPTPVKIQQLRDAVCSRLRILGAQGVFIACRNSKLGVMD